VVVVLEEVQEEPRVEVMCCVYVGRPAVPKWPRTAYYGAEWGRARNRKRGWGKGCRFPASRKQQLRTCIDIRTSRGRGEPGGSGRTRADGGQGKRCQRLLLYSSSSSSSSSPCSAAATAAAAASSSSHPSGCLRFRLGDDDDPDDQQGTIPPPLPPPTRSESAI